MKRILTFLLVLLVPMTMRAVVAPKTPYPYTQPDGTVIMLVNHGDEFHSWVTCDGRMVEKDAQGFYRPVSSTGPITLKAQNARLKRQQAQDIRKKSADGRLGMGEKHFMVILVEFQDLLFTVPNPQDAFDRLLNEPGYAENGGTGSVKDFYTDNSSGQFKPTFDVYGPVKVPKNHAYYGAPKGRDNDAHADEALFDACTILNETVDFSQYDLDGDGYVDNVFFYFAGHNQAEGGGEDAIWPHQWVLYNFNGTFDGVRVWSYACSSEYKGSEGETMAGIGTFIHEFGHVLGLPDFYDTDYEENGQAYDHPASFSTMASGNYLNEGRTPCNFTSVERQLLGWMGDFQVIAQSGSYSLGALSANSIPLTTQADADGEQFIYEFRDGSGWDSYLPAGMVVYHLDASSNLVGDGYTARQLWDYSSINIYGDHPCFRVIPSMKDSRTPESTVFPGTGQVTDFVPVPWSGFNLGVELNGIRMEDGMMKMTVFSSSRRRVWGRVTDNKGVPLEGAKLLLGTKQTGGIAQTGKPKLLSMRPSAEEIRYQTTTEADGSYQILLDEGDETGAFRMSVSCVGYIEQAREVNFTWNLHSDFALRPVGSPSHADLKHYDLDVNQNLQRTGFGTSLPGIMGASYFSPDDLSDYVGMQVKTVSFVTGSAAKSVHVLIDSDSERLLSREVQNQITVGAFEEVDVSDQKIFIQPNTGMYFGYAVQDSEDGHPLVYQDLPGAKGFYYSIYQLDQVNWHYSQDGSPLLVSVTLADDAASKYLTLSSMNLNTIDNPGRESGYKSGDLFTFKLLDAIKDKPSDVVWFYDGVQQNGGSVTLTSGTHTVTAKLSFPDGGSEELILDLIVQ